MSTFWPSKPSAKPLIDEKLDWSSCLTSISVEGDLAFASSEAAVLPRSRFRTAKIRRFGFDFRISLAVSRPMPAFAPVMRTVQAERLAGTICGILVNCDLKKSMMMMVVVVVVEVRTPDALFSTEGNMGIELRPRHEDRG